MDILAIVEDRLDFIERFYDRAATSFETDKQKIEAQEEPFVPQCEPGAYDGFEYQCEWNEADDCLRVLGHCSLGLVEKRFTTTCESSQIAKVGPGPRNQKSHGSTTTVVS
jgi:hypothetical protein